MRPVGSLERSLTKCQPWRAGSVSCPETSGTRCQPLWMGSEGYLET